MLVVDPELAGCAGRRAGNWACHERFRVVSMALGQLGLYAVLVLLSMQTTRHASRG